MFLPRPPRTPQPGDRRQSTDHAGRPGGATGPARRERPRGRLADDSAAPRVTIATRGQETAQGVGRLLSQSQLAAPAHLRARVQEMTLRPQPQGSRARRPLPRGSSVLALGGCLAGAAAAVALLIGGGGAPTVARAAALALRSPSAAAPTAGSDGRHLDAAVQGVSFPNWAPRWRTAGTRVDHLDGRLARTVTYEDSSGRRVGYVIVAGPALAVPAGAGRTLATVRYATISRSGAVIVSWRRGNHTCILVSRRVSALALIDLARGVSAPAGYSA